MVVGTHRSIAWRGSDSRPDRALADLRIDRPLSFGNPIGSGRRAAALAEAIGRPISTHLLPEISARLMCVTPTAHWLEYVDWANGIRAEPLAIGDGRAIVPERPGNGLARDEAAVARCRA